MIALKDNLPLVQFASGEAIAFEREWLVRSLLHAAQKAGYPQWWLATHVTESVATYLFLNFEATVIALPQLTVAVKSVLQVIGYAEVADHFVPEPPPVKISLTEIARDAGTGYELAFFEMLGRAMQQLISADAAYFELFGLERCVKQLRAKKVWSRDCDYLRAEIVSFVREQISGARIERRISFSLA